MTVMTMLPQSRPLTYADLDAMPDDGHRYELIDGTLIVTPAPLRRHQRAVGELHLLLRASCPAEFEVLLAPYDVKLAEDTVLQPDLLVARRSDTTERHLPSAPLLAVEVLSPSTRLVDLNLKKARYEQAGCSSYWVVDPTVPSVTIWELEEQTYGAATTAEGEETLAVTTPFPLVLQPTRLTG